MSNLFEEFIVILKLLKFKVSNQLKLRLHIYFYALYISKHIPKTKQNPIILPPITTTIVIIILTKVNNIPVTNTFHYQYQNRIIFPLPIHIPILQYHGDVIIAKTYNICNGNIPVTNTFQYLIQNPYNIPVTNPNPNTTAKHTTITIIISKSM